jgi:hypothetical protein
MKSQSLQSGPARGPPIATFAIGVPQHPERLAISAAIRTAGWRKFVQRRDVTPHPPHFREWSNS